jgi:protein-tyrosine phosphatase
MLRCIVLAPAEITRLFLTDLAAAHGSVHACVTHQLGLDEELIAQFRRRLLRS